MATTRTTRSTRTPTPEHYLLQEPETGLYLAKRDDGQVTIARRDRALQFHTSAAAIEYGAGLATPCELVREVA